MIVTVSALIGNSDDKLTQLDWADYCRDFKVFVDLYARPVHFWGNSQPLSKYQNACAVFEMDTQEFESLKEDFRFLAEKYRQDSIVVITGMADFISGEME